jgi:His/Glu/Gln/Arg/opine family amino acid ABC transporter permease subunit
MFDWRWGFTFEILPRLIVATGNTLLAAGIGYAIAIVLGLVFALAQRTPFRPLTFIVRELVEFIRSTPLVLQIFFVFYVRFLVAIGLHTGRLSVAEAEEMFRTSGFQDPGNARQQAARGTFDPAYLNYTMGKLMIRKLRQDWTASRGGPAAWREFHDTFLSYGAPPIPLVRQAMMGEDGGGLI